MGGQALRLPSLNEKMKYILWLALVALPWVKLEIYPRVTIIDMLFGLWLLLFLLKWLLRPLPKPSPVIFSYGLVLLLWLTAVWNSGLQARHTYAFLFDAIAYTYLAVLSWTLAYALSISTLLWKTVKTAILTGFVIHLLFGFVGLITFIFLHNFVSPFYSETHKLIGTFKFPNQTASFLVLFLPLVFLHAMQASRLHIRLFWGLMVILTLIEIGATGSRSGIAVAAIMLVILLIYSMRQYSLRYGIMLYAAVGVSFIFLIGLQDIGLYAIGRASQVFTMLMHGYFIDEFRLHNWYTGLQIFTSHILTGYGVGNVALDFRFETHNTFLAAASEAGLPGLLALTILVGITLIWTWKNIQRSYAFTQESLWALALCIGLLGEWIFGTQHMLLRARHLWVALALVVAQHHILVRASRNRKEVISPIDTR